LKRSEDRPVNAVFDRMKLGKLIRLLQEARVDPDVEVRIATSQDPEDELNVDVVQESENNDGEEYVVIFTI
jgi:hypothetical protein